MKIIKRVVSTYYARIYFSKVCFTYEAYALCIAKQKQLAIFFMFSQRFFYHAAKGE